MGNRFLEKALRATGVAIASWALQTPLVHAESDGPLRTEMSPIGGTTLALGEPITLRSQILNTSGQTIAVHLGTYATEWYSLSLTDAEGKTVKAAVDTRPQEPTGLHATADRPMPPGEDITEYTVVTRDFIVPHPGRYQLTVHVHMAYGQVAPDDYAPSIWKTAIANAGTVLTQDFTYSLLVTPTNLTRLGQKATQLQQEIAAHPYGDLSNALTTALFSMPEAEAAASWWALIDNPGMASGLYASELKRLGTPTAADLLAGMLSNPSLSSDDKAYIGQCLNEMYNGGSAPLRQHISQLAAASGLSLPDQIIIPKASD